MTEINTMTYEEKEKRLEEILQRLDNSQTPVDKLAAEAREAANLITSMSETLKGARKELTDVFSELDKLQQKQE
jgi:exodeoxyribonuclease VII small subunit